MGSEVACGMGTERALGNLGWVANQCTIKSYWKGASSPFPNSICMISFNWITLLKKTERGTRISLMLLNCHLGFWVEQDRPRGKLRGALSLGRIACWARGSRTLLWFSLPRGKPSLLPWEHERGLRVPCLSRRRRSAIFRVLTYDRCKSPHSKSDRLTCSLVINKRELSCKVYKHCMRAVFRWDKVWVRDHSKLGSLSVKLWPVYIHITFYETGDRLNVKESLCFEIEGQTYWQFHLLCNLCCGCFVLKVKPSKVCST